MAKGIAKLIKKLPDNGYIFKDSFELNHHSKKRPQPKPDNSVIGLEGLKHIGYTDADIRLIRVVRGKLQCNH